jgi:hypothetical protein
VGGALTTVAVAQPAAAYLPNQGSMYHMGTTIADTSSFHYGSWNAVDRSLAWAGSITKCPSGNGTFTQLISHMRADISHGRQTIAGVAIRNGDTCGGTYTPMSKWSAKVKDITTSIEKIPGWQR